MQKSVLELQAAGTILVPGHGEPGPDLAMSAVATPPGEAQVNPAQPDSAKRRQILEGARAAFLAMGFDGASMNDVARLAGVSKGTLYVYFTNKEALFEALIREERRQQAEQLFVLDDSSHDVRLVLTALGISLIEIMTSPKSIAQIRTVIGVVNKFPQVGRAFFEAGPHYGIERLSIWLSKQAEAGFLRLDDPRLAAMQFMELCQAGVFKRLLFGMVETVEPGAIRHSVEAAVNVFMAAYGRATAADMPQPQG
jgi:AcrR family transcriptional regulator